MSLKERIHLGEPFHIGLLSVGQSPDEVAAKAAAQDWDLAFVDLQHTPHTEPQLVEFCHAATNAGVPVMLRVQHPQAAWQIGRYLDFGAAGVLVPLSETAEGVAAAIDNFYYPPVGRRSCGLRHAYGWSGKNSPREYADWWNANGILALQIETVPAVINVRQLVRPGVDMLLFGACDLEFSLGATPDCPFTSVEECHRFVVEQTRDLDVRIGVGNMPFGQF